MRKRLAMWSVANSFSPLNLLNPFKFTLFYISCSWVGTRIDVSRIFHILIKTPLASLCVWQPPRCKEDLQVNNVSLKVGGVVCSGISWESLEAALMGEGMNVLYKISQTRCSLIIQILKVTQIYIRWRGKHRSVRVQIGIHVAQVYGIFVKQLCRP